MILRKVYRWDQVAELFSCLSIFLRALHPFSGHKSTNVSLKTRSFSYMRGENDYDSSLGLINRHCPCFRGKSTTDWQPWAKGHFGFHPTVLESADTGSVSRQNECDETKIKWFELLKTAPEEMQQINVSHTAGRISLWLTSATIHQIMDAKETIWKWNG